MAFAQSTNLTRSLRNSPPEGETLLTVTVKNRPDNIDNAHKLIGDRLDEICGVYLNAFRYMIVKKGMGEPPLPSSEREISLEIVLAATNLVTPATNLVLSIEKDRPNSQVHAALIRQDVIDLLEADGFSAIAERFQSASEDICATYPLLILAAAYVKIERF